MAFWSQRSKEPHRQNRWFVYFGESGLDDSYRWAIKDIQKPNFKIDTTSHVLVNKTFNYPKNLVWQPIEFTMVSVPADKPNVASLPQVLMDIIYASGYSDDLSYQSMEKMPYKTVGVPLSNIRICQVDANGYIIEEWKIYSSIITGINFGSLSYENEGLVDIKVNLTYDHAELLSEEQIKSDNPLLGKTSTSEYALLRAENKLSPDGKSVVNKGTPGFPNDLDSLQPPARPIPPLRLDNKLPNKKEFNILNSLNKTFNK